MFCSIQAAINDAQTLNGHVINVDSGYYNESVVINKQLTVVGNSGSPNSRPTVEGVSGQTFSVTSANVTINNFLVKFNQGTVNTGILAATSGTFNNLTIKNSVVNGTATTGVPVFNSFGMQLGTFGAGPFDNVNIDSNEVTHTGTSPLGRGVRTNNCYGSWKFNDINGFYAFQAGGIGGGLVNIEGNNLKGSTEINSPGAGAHTFINNVCEPANAFGPGTDFALLELKNISTAGSSLSITGNAFQNYVNFGLFSGRANNVTIDNNTFTPDLSAVNFRSIRIDTKQRTTATQSAFTSGAVILNNSFYGNTALSQAGVSVELANSDNISTIGTVTLGTAVNENLFQINVNKNISLNNETTSTSGDPVWNGTYVSTKGKVTANVDGTNNKYDVGSGLELPSAMSLANLFLLEDKVQHVIDDSGLGFVTVKANNDYVTVNSFVSPATTTPSVQRGINAASASWTVNVKDGTYNEDININKALTVLGQSHSAILRGLYNAAPDAVFMSSSNSILRNVTVTRDYGVTLTDWNNDTKNQGVNIAQTTTGVTIDKVRFHSNRNAIFCNNAQNVTIINSIIDSNRTGIHFGNNFSGAEVHNNFIRNNFTHGILFNYDLASGVICTDVHVTNNSITGNWYSQVNFQRNTATPFGDHTGLSFSCNWYGTATPLAVAAAAGEPGYAAQTPSQFGGTDPGLNRQLYGLNIASCPYTPWLTVGTDDDLFTAGFQPTPGACNGLPSTRFYVNDGSTANDVFTSNIGNNSNNGSAASPFLTITYAMLVALPSDTIFIDAGTYQEEINTNKSLTIRGADSAGSSAAVVKAPAVMSPISNGNGSGFTSVIYISGPSTSFNISHIAVDGDGRGGAKFSGVYYFEASGSFTNSRITKVRDATYSGVQSGNAFFANHTYDVSMNQTVTVSNNMIDDYQKTGILINELNTHGIVTNNIVTGQNTQHVNGQNGIQFGYGSYGIITSNIVSGDQYNGPAPDDASGILLAGVGVDQTNTPTGNTTTIGGAGLLANNVSACEVGLLTDAGGFGYDSNAGVIYNSNNFSNNYIHVSESSPNTVPSLSNVYDKRIDNTSQTNIVYGQIQRSIDDASATNVLNVSAHTFTEQVEIHKALTLAGQGSGLTTIVSPNTLPLFFVTGANNNRAVVYVHDTSGVTIKNLTVDGAGKGNANYRFIGIGYRNAGGTVRDCEIKSIRETPMNGNQHGVGIYAFDDNGTARALNVLHNTIYDFQKNGTSLSGVNLTTVVDSNTVTGSGPINFIAQNGIQVGFGAKGSIKNNKVSNINFTMLTAASCGILIYQPSDTVVVSGDTVSNCQTGVYMQDGNVNLTNSRITNSTGSMGATPNWWGVISEKGTFKITGNTINGGDTTKAEGMNPYSGNAETTNITFTNNFVSNCLDGIIVENTGSGIVNGEYHDNSITLSATAIRNSTTLLQNAGILKQPNTEMQINTYRPVVKNEQNNSYKGDANGKSNGPLAATIQSATCNWYGTTNGSIVTSKISGAVVYVPYLTNGTDFNAAPGFQPIPGSCNGINASIINIKVVPEGFYDPGTQTLSIKDTVKAYLHLNFSPYTILDSAKSTVDSLTLTGSFQFTQPNGTYYIVIKHRNTIETWSKSGGEIFTAGTSMNYDFTTSASQAFGNNMKMVNNAPTTYAIYSGDVNQDGIVDASDMLDIYNDVIGSTTGYVRTDVNGDYFVDVSDLIITYNNAINTVVVAAP
ncbi:MAG: right-handed parallel beta-helix repeat-containing protein [bacterium]|nr:right-handed parallel beta-helix repeat-containing protein [bacterium]